MSEDKFIRYISVISFIVGIILCLLLTPTRATTVHGTTRTEPSSGNHFISTIPITVTRGGDPFLRIKSNSCIFRIEVNNAPLTDTTIPFCDGFRGRVFRINQLAHSGEIKIQLEVQNDKNLEIQVIGERSPWSILTSAFLLLTSCIFGLLSFRWWERVPLLFTEPSRRILYEGFYLASGIILILWIVHFYLHSSPSITSLAVTCALSSYLLFIFLPKRKIRELIQLHVAEKNITARVGLLLMGAGAFTVVSVISLIRHWDLRSLAYDLGIQENVLWNTLHGKPFLSSVMDGLPYLGNHTVVAYLLLLPVYFLFQTTETLLLLQAGLVCSTIIPLFLIARSVLKSEPLAALLSGCFLLHPAILGASCNDFHELSLAPPTLMWISYCALFNKRLALASFTLVASCIKEDMSLNLSLLGGALFALNFYAKGCYLIICGILSYVTWQVVVIPSFAGYNSSYVWYLSKSIGSVNSPSQVLYHILESPFTVIAPLLNEEKLKFFFQTVGAFAFLPWSSLFGVIATSYGNALVVLSGHWPLYTLGYHYIFPWVTIMNLITVLVIASKRSPVGRYLLVGVVLLSHSWLFINYGPLFPREFFAVGPSHQQNPFQFVNNERTRDEITLIRKLIPTQASVLAEEHILPHFSRRSRVQALHRSSKDLLHTFDFCIAEKKNGSASCDEIGCSGKEISKKDASFLVCSREYY